jgi:DNA-binding transcriptional MerR regulator
LDKAPDAFRTISEVAEELDIPQHVLRFWETRFSQIKPMKRSGGRRYYRPDDVDLLKGIRRLLYGEGYTIRGVQRILKEHGIKSVQAVADESSAVSFNAIEDAIGLSLQEPDAAGPAGLDGEDEDFEISGDEEGGIDYRFVDPDEDGILAPFAKGRAAPSAQPAVTAPPPPRVAPADRDRLQRALQDLVAARQLLDAAIKDG